MKKIQCPECRREQSCSAQYCTNCGFKLNSHRRATKVKSCAILVISVILIIVATSLVTSNEYCYYLDNIPYYAEQYADMKAHSSGFLGSNYAFLASSWKELYDEAVAYVTAHSIGAGILVICGSLGLFFGLKKLKQTGGTESGAY